MGLMHQHVFPKNTAVKTNWDMNYSHTCFEKGQIIEDLKYWQYSNRGDGQNSYKNILLNPTRDDKNWKFPKGFDMLGF